MGIFFSFLYTKSQPKKTAYDKGCIYAFKIFIIHIVCLLICFQISCFALFSPKRVIFNDFATCVMHSVFLRIEETNEPQSLNWSKTILCFLFVPRNVLSFQSLCLSTSCRQFHQRSAAFTTYM